MPFNWELLFFCFSLSARFNEILESYRNPRRFMCAERPTDALTVYCPLIDLNWIKSGIFPSPCSSRRCSQRATELFVSYEFSEIYMLFDVSIESRSPLEYYWPRRGGRTRACFQFYRWMTWLRNDHVFTIIIKIEWNISHGFDCSFVRFRVITLK